MAYLQIFFLVVQVFSVGRVFFPEIQAYGTVIQINNFTNNKYNLKKLSEQLE